MRLKRVNGVRDDPNDGLIALLESCNDRQVVLRSFLQGALELVRGQVHRRRHRACERLDLEVALQVVECVRAHTLETAEVPKSGQFAVDRLMQGQKRLMLLLL